MAETLGRMVKPENPTRGLNPSIVTVVVKVYFVSYKPSFRAIERASYNWRYINRGRIADILLQPILKGKKGRINPLVVSRRKLNERKSLTESSKDLRLSFGKTDGHNLLQHKRKCRFYSGMVSTPNRTKMPNALLLE